MARHELDALVAYHHVHSTIEVPGPTQTIPRKPISRHISNESQVRLLPSPLTSAAGETASLVSHGTDTTRDRPARHKKGPSVLHDLILSDHWSIAFHQIATLSVIGLIITSVFVSRKIIVYDQFDGSPCDSGGNFRLYGVDSFWLLSRVFEITIAFGNFSFSNAKLIDVLWDVVIGRGGQALVAYISYRVYAKSLTTIMERSFVTLDVFDSIALRGGVSVTSIVALIRDFLTNATMRARVSMSWIIISSIYALFFQTLLSAMTGYSANSTPYVQLPNGSQQPWSSFVVVTYAIHDASRIGLSSDYLLFDQYGGQYSSCYDLWSSNDNYPGDGSQGLDYHGIPPECQVLISTFVYVSALGNKPTNRTSTFVDPTNYNKTIYLEAPTLNISQFYDGLWVLPPTSDSGASLDSVYSIPSEGLTATYNGTYVQDKGTCSPAQTYQWGFSGLLLFFAMILTTIWAVGMWIMWIDAHYQSKLDYYGRQLGGFRAALDIAKVLYSEMDDSEDIDRLSDKAVRKRAKTGRDGATISYVDLITEKTMSNRASRPARWLDWKLWGWINQTKFWGYVKRHKRWASVIAAIIAIVVIAVPNAVSISRSPD